MHNGRRGTGRGVWQVAAAFVVMIVCAWPGGAAQAQVTDEIIQERIDGLVERIYRARYPHGTWDPPNEGSGHVFGQNWGGTTAIMTFALLTAGESYQNPRLRPAIEFLKEAELRGTYAVAFRAHVWAALPDEFEPYLRRDVQWLINALGPSGYDYTSQPRYDRVDNSVTQYGVLGVWEGAKRGMPVPNNYWEAIQEHFVRHQLADGSWSYGGANAADPSQRNARGSMAAAGVAALYITQDYLHRGDFRQVGRTPQHPVQRRITRGLEWFAENFRPDTNPGAGGYYQYYLYGVERIGLASGIKYFAGHDWYQSGAEHLLQNPGADTDAAFTLMFLVRGRVPVLMNKLQIEDYHWNNRPRDVANLTAWVSDETERQLIWQVLPLSSEPEEWLDAPLLYLSGHEALSLSEEQEQKLKRYIDLGGLLITTADDGREAFSSSVEQMLERLYPQYELTEFAEEDELLNMVFPLGSGTRYRNGFNPKSIHNGVRHLAIHLPGDVSWTLHRNDQSNAAVWQFFTNAYFYATERGRVRNRLDTHYVRARRRGGENLPAVTVGRAAYAGNHDPEPLAWEIQQNFMLNEDLANVRVERVQLDSLPSPAETPFVHVVGTEAHAFSEAERESIRQYVEQGGLMLFENAGGRGDFASAANMEMGEIFGRRLRPISFQSSMITGDGIGGNDVSKVTYRPFTVLRMGEVTAPRLLALTVDEEVRVVISHEDLSKAMLNQPVWGVFGYSPESAHRIMANMVLRARGGRGEE